MSESVVVALITAITSVVGTASLVNWRLASLEKKVDSHNSYAQLFAEHTKDIALMQKDINYIKEKMEG